MRKILGPSNMHWLYIYVSGGYFTLRILVFEQVNTHRLLFEGRCACGIEVHIDITPTWAFTGRLYYEGNYTRPAAEELDVLFIGKG